MRSSFPDGERMPSLVGRTRKEPCPRSGRTPPLRRPWLDGPRLCCAHARQRLPYLEDMSRFPSAPRGGLPRAEDRGRKVPASRSSLPVMLRGSVQGLHTTFSPHATTPARPSLGRRKKASQAECLIRGVRLRPRPLGRVAGASSRGVLPAAPAFGPESWQIPVRRTLRCAPYSLP